MNIEETEIIRAEMKITYEPSSENQEWLNWLLTQVKALPYDASARWGFYDVFQNKPDVFPLQKKPDTFKGTNKEWRLKAEKNHKFYAYHNKFLPTTAKVRKAFWNGWAPDTFADDTRNMTHYYGTRNVSVDEWLESMRDRTPTLQSEDEQEKLVFVVYEARAMSDQFEYYLGNPYRICLVPLAGDPSVGYRWQVAKDIERCCDLFDKEPVICYFGDMDEKGSQIPVSAMADIRKWCRYPIEFHRLGINEEHVKKYNIQVDETGKKFQWEALDDATAHSLLDQVFQYWDKEVIARVKGKEQDGHDLWSSVVGDAIRKAKSC